MAFEAEADGTPQWNTSIAAPLHSLGARRRSLIERLPAQIPDASEGAPGTMPQARTCQIFSAGMPRPQTGTRLAAACMLLAMAAWGGNVSENKEPDSLLSAAPIGGRADTLRLPDARAARPLPPPTDVAKTVIVPTDVDRQLGNLADMLQRAAGLHVVRTGDMGDYVGVSVWGSSEQQVNLYVDGVLQNQANDGSMFLGDWDLSRVERVEVYKGLAPDHLAGSPMGGSINIITRDGNPGIGVRGALAGGSFGSLRAHGSAAYEARGWRGRVEAARNQSDGDFPYYDDNGTEFEPGRHPEGAKRRTAGQLTRKIRRNNAHGFSETAVNASYSGFEGWNLGAQGDFTWLHKQIPFPGASADSTVINSAFRESDRMFLRGYGTWSNADAEASFDLSGNLQREAYVDTAMGKGAVGVGYQDEENAYSNLIASIWGRARLVRGFTLAALASYGVSAYGYTDRSKDRGYPGLIRYSGDGKLTPVYTYGRHTLEIILAAIVTLEEQAGKPRYSSSGAVTPIEDWDAHGSLRLGYQYHIRDGVWASAQGGSSYRIPSFLERFGDRGTIVATSGLVTETGINASLGLHAEGRRLSADLQGFASEGDNIITLEQLGQYQLHYRNAGATRVFGVESRLTAAPSPWTRTELDVTLQKAVDISGGARGEYNLIPYRPLTQASLRQNLFWGRWTLSAAGYYQGLAYPNASNEATIFDSYSHNTGWQLRCDADLSWRIRHLMLAAGVRNLTNERLFDFFTYPLPGRSYAAALQAEY
ncbi:MAG: TonB-dependent receptor plug domain-containing protein [Fibrobacteria bacterium]